MSQDCSHGPVSSMPGHTTAAQAGTTCDDHPDIPAVIRVQGETDSFGCEYMHFCQPCHEAFKLAREQARLNPEEIRCDYCKQMATDCRPQRDYDEGSSGPVYDVCGACRTEVAKREAEEAKAYYAEYGPDDYFDFDSGDD